MRHSNQPLDLVVQRIHSAAPAAACPEEGVTMEYSEHVLNAGEPLAGGSASHAPRPRGLLVAALVAGLFWAGACTTSPSATGEAGAWAGTVVSTPFGNGTLV